MDSFERYEINVEKELLLEYSAEILANFERYFDKNNIEVDYSIPIEKEANSIILLYKIVANLKDEILTEKYKKLNNVLELKGKFQLAMDFIYRI